MSEYTEDKLIEQPAIKLFKDELGYEYIYAYYENYGENSLLGRMERDEVILLPKLISGEIDVLGLNIKVI